MKTFFAHWMKFLQRFYGLILIVALVLSFFAFPRMVRLFKNISTDPMDLLPADTPSVQALTQIRDKLQPKKRFSIILESENPEHTRRLLADLKPLFEKSPYVGEAYYTKPGYAFFDKHKMLYLELKDLEEIRDRVRRKIQQEKLGGLYINFDDESEDSSLDFGDLEEKYHDRYGGGVESEYYLNPDGKSYAIYVESKEANLDLSKEMKFQDSIRSIMNGVDVRAYDPTMKVYFGSSSRIMEYRALLRDLKIAGIISGAMIFLPLLIRFRRPRYVLLIFLPLLLGVPSGLALASFWVHKLNVTTSFLFAILGGLGVETGIHLFSRYREKRLDGASSEDSLLDLYCFLGPAILTAVASLAVTFLLLMVSQFRGFSEFGLISGIGLWTVFLYYFTVLPALLILAEKIGWLKFRPNVEAAAPLRWSFTPAFVKTLLVIFTGFTVFSILVTPKVSFEYNFKKIRADNPTDRLAKEKMRTTAGTRINSPAAVLIQTPEQAEALTQALKARRDATPRSTIDYGTSVYALLPKQQEEKMAVIREIQAFLEDDTVKLVKNERKKDLDRFKQALAESDVVQESQIPQKMKDLFIGRPEKPGSLFLVNAKPRLELDDGRNAIAFANEVENIPTSQGVFHASSDAIVFANVLKTMFRDSRMVLLISVLSVFTFVLLDFRSFKKTLLVMFSILSGVFWVMGVMYLLGIKLNLYNMVMIPAVMGMSIDNSIHIYHRYEELGPGSLGEVLRTAGLSSLLASTTNAAGFFGLIFCTHGGLRSMGILATVGLLTCLVTTLVYLPMMLQFLETRRSRRT